MLRIPDNLIPYVDFDDGEIIGVNLPPALEAEFAELKRTYEDTKADALSDY